MSNPDASADRQYRKIINAWAMYDWANSAFYTTIVTAIFPLYYRSLVINAGGRDSDATAYLGYTSAAAVLVIAILGPILGTLADCTGGKKRFIRIFAGIGIVSTALMFFLSGSSFILASILFMVANIGVAGSIIFYEALLPHIARPGELDRVSSRGFAIGYCGGGTLLVMNVLWITHPEWFHLPSRDFAVRLSFLSVAIWWALFSIPLFRHVPEPLATCPVRRSLAETTRASFQQLGRTLRHISRFNQLVLFLVGFWIYNDAISTIIKLSTAYGDEIRINQNAMITALVITQFVGIPCALAFGWLAGRIGTKDAILLGLAVYIGISVVGAFIDSEKEFYLLAIAVGLVQGGTQALSRSLFASMVPKHHTAEFFAFYSTGAKFAGILGPAIFGIVAQTSGSSRPAIMSISLFFVIGGWLLLKVNETEGRQVARDEEARELAAAPNVP